MDWMCGGTEKKKVKQKSDSGVFHRGKKDPWMDLIMGEEQLAFLIPASKNSSEVPAADLAFFFPLG